MWSSFNYNILKTTVPPQTGTEGHLFSGRGAKQARLSDRWFCQKGGVIVFNQPQKMAT